MSVAGWIGVDLDGTLAKYEAMDVWDGSVGPPVPAMLNRVRVWLAEGRDVRIVTARVAPFQFDDGGDNGIRSVERQIEIVQAWLLEHVGQILPVTCSKDYGMAVLYDDRAVQVETNTGRLIEERKYVPANWPHAAEDF